MAVKIIVLAKIDDSNMTGNAIDIEFLTSSTKINEYSRAKAKRFKLDSRSAALLFININTINSQYLKGVLTAKMTALQIVYYIYDIIESNGKY